MSRLARYTQKLFGSSAGGNQMSEYGSYAAGSPQRYSGATISPDIVQNLSNYLTGILGATVGNASIPKEDLNSLCYLFSYQIAYALQSGIPEWDTATTYYIGQIASDGAGNLFISLTNTNAGNALTDNTKWKKIAGVPVVQAKSADYTLDLNDALVCFTGTHNAVLPDPSTCVGNVYTIKNNGTGTITVSATGGATIDDASTYSLSEKYQFVRVQAISSSAYAIIGW